MIRFARLKIRSSGQALAVLLAAGGLPSMASAQAAADAAPAPAPAASNQIGDIVVTAEKRIGTAQTTPIAMNVFDKNSLARNGVHDLQSLASVSPSFSFAENETSAIITLRGVTTSDYSEVGDPAVAVSTDGFYEQRPEGLNAGLFDLERIEVLRGPQGTLYGRNATGGAINVITAKPTDKFGGYASLTYGNYNTLNAEGAINVPVSQTFMVRASFMTQNHDGYLKLDPGPDGNDADTRAARLEALWKPTDRLSVLLTGSYMHLGGIGPQGVGIPYVAADDGSNSSLRPSIPGSGHVYAENTDEYYRMTSRTFQWNIAYAFDPVTITYLGGYNAMKSHYNTDLDGTADYSDDFPNNESPKTTNHEVRISSNGHGPFKFQAGYFHFNEDNKLYSTLRTTTDGVPYAWGIFDYDVNAHSNAVFGQASYTLSNGLSFEGGIRYTKDSKSRVGSKNFFGTEIPEDSHEKSSAVTWHAAVNWQVTPRNLFYVKADKGYKAGGFNNGSVYKPEYIVAYEAGTKNYLFDRMLQLNLSGFYYDYKDMQVTQFVGGEDRSVTDNAGKARIYGLELETVLKPTHADQLDFSASWLHAEFTRFETVNADNVNVDLAGNRLVQAPRLSLTGGYQHSFDIFNGTLVARAQVQYQSASYLTFYNRPDDRQSGYTKTDLSLEYKDRKGWALQGFVRNLENNLTLVWAAENNSYGNNYYQFAAPRTFGARLRVDF